MIEPTHPVTGCNAISKFSIQGGFVKAICTK